MPAASAQQRLTLRRREKFLARLREGFSILAACEASGLNRRVAYRHRETDPEFASAWDEALEEGTDRLEDEARRRAVDGVEKVVVSAGAIVEILDPETGCKSPLMVTTYSDRLLVKLLEARRPAKFRSGVQVNMEADDAAEVLAILQAARKRALLGAGAEDPPADGDPVGSRGPHGPAEPAS